MHFDANDAALISSVKTGDGAVDYTIEVGTGTVELITGPHADLHALEAAHSAALRRLQGAAAAEGLAILGCGVQPVTPPSAQLMTPRPRYALLESFLGDGWALFSATASDQCHVEVTRGDAALVAAAANAAAPALIGLCGNSGIVGGRPAPAAYGCCAREGAIVKDHIGHRHGMPPAPS